MRFDKLLVIRRHNKTEDGDHSPIWECKCDCGNIVYVTSNNLRNGNTHSCGCIKKEMLRNKRTKHGAKTPNADNDLKRLYSIWKSMKTRCNNPNCKDYKDYGGRGIIICDDWLNSFDTFREWAVANGYNKSLSIDRVDVNGNYEPSNCRWATALEQAHNKRK